jgi:hypothetical protein
VHFILTLWRPQMQRILGHLQTFLTFWLQWFHITEKTLFHIDLFQDGNYINGLEKELRYFWAEKNLKQDCSTFMVSAYIHSIDPQGHGL